MSNFLKHIQTAEASLSVKLNEMKKYNVVDLIITDIIMPNMDGLDLIGYAHENLDVKIIAISGGGVFISSKKALANINEQVDLCLEKPIDVASILTAIKRILG